MNDLHIQFSKRRLVRIATILLLGICQPVVFAQQQLSEDYIDGFNKTASELMKLQEAKSDSNDPDKMNKHVLREMKNDAQHREFIEKYLEVKSAKPNTAELIQRVNNLADIGVTINPRYRGSRSRYLIKLGNQHRLKPSTKQILREAFSPYWDTHQLDIPVVRTISESELESLESGAFTLFATPYLDFGFIAQLAHRFGGLDYDELIEAIAAHEATHAIVHQMYKDLSRIEDKIDDINRELEGLTRFTNRWAVGEFLADAIHVQINDAGIMYAASRLRIREQFHPHKPLELSRYYGTALFLFNMLKRYEETPGAIKIESSRSLDWLIRQDIDEENIWYWHSEHWKPYLDAIVSIPELTTLVRQEYLSAFHQIHEILQ